MLGGLGGSNSAHKGCEKGVAWLQGREQEWNISRGDMKASSAWRMHAEPARARSAVADRQLQQGIRGLNIPGLMPVASCRLIVRTSHHGPRKQVGARQLATH